MFNQVILIGNLTADPELRDAGSTKVCQMRIATNKVRIVDGEKKEYAQFHTVIAWDKQGETCAQYLQKGRKVHIVGELQHRQWDKDDGTKGYATEVRAFEVNFLDKGPDTSGDASFDPEGFDDI